MSRNEPLPQNAKRVGFGELFAIYGIIEIPLIQRDYAQGRKSESEVRTLFLRALHTALTEQKPLDLDFVYGHVDRPDIPAFRPLDGQQRLTTLFLLHWYLAWRDGEIEHFKAMLQIGEQSRLRYAVRPSAREFFDELVCRFPEASAPRPMRLSKWFVDQPWFYRSWKLDPTVQSALTMLDAIDEQFWQSQGCYSTLVRAEEPCVTFHLLDLGQFGLSDDLYIKMNARGRSLTEFETFKARLGQHLETIFSGQLMTLPGQPTPVSVKDYFSHRIDKEWTDLFWDERNQVDHRFMELLRALALVTRLPLVKNADDLAILRQAKVKTISFAQYEALGCLTDHRLVQTLIGVLDCWSAQEGEFKAYMQDTHYFDAVATYKKVIANSTDLTYEQQVQFYAYCSYLAQHGRQAEAEPLENWMRVVSNLAEQTTYDGLDDLKRSLEGVDSMLGHSADILAYLSPGAAHEVKGFYVPQMREEKLKAALMCRNSEWNTLIRRAERHHYFRGQIGFLLAFCGALLEWAKRAACDWSDPEDETYRRDFLAYLEKAEAVFNASGLIPISRCKWERALLALGDYLPEVGSNNTFLVNAGRDTSWKRFLRGGDDWHDRRSFVQALFDKIDLHKGVEASLDEVLNSAPVPAERWRRVIVAEGGEQMIEYCKHRMIRWHTEDEVYLLASKRRSAAHVDLFSYHLSRTLLARKHGRGELEPFGRPDDSGSVVPYTRLECTLGVERVELQIPSRQSGYALVLAGALPSDLTNWLCARMGYIENKGQLIREVSEHAIESALDDLILAFRQYVG